MFRAQQAIQQNSAFTMTDICDASGFATVRSWTATRYAPFQLTAMNCSLGYDLALA